jgi:hypothetical protein
MPPHFLRATARLRSVPERRWSATALGTTDEPPSPSAPSHEEVASSALSRRLVAGLILLAVVLANGAFAGLGSVFEYPDILQRSPDEVLARFRADQAAVVALFTALALSSALLAPIAILLGRLAGGARGRWSIRIGVAAAAVQVAGLLRWPLIVPGLADRGDADAFETVHTLLGTVVGETLGYLLTATWTVLIVSTLARRLTGRWFSVLGLVAAALIAVGVLVPLGVPGTDLANFVGYIVWSLWLLGLAALVWRRGATPPTVGTNPPGV